MIEMKLNSGESFQAKWAEVIKSGIGGIILEVDFQPFSAVAAMLENASAMSWTDDYGEHNESYSGIRYMSHTDTPLQIVLNKG